MLKTAIGSPPISTSFRSRLNDKNSPLVGLNIRETEVHVKLRGPRDRGVFLKPSVGQPHKGSRHDLMATTD